MSKIIQKHFIDYLVNHLEVNKEDYINRFLDYLEDVSSEKELGKANIETVFEVMNDSIAEIKKLIPKEEGGIKQLWWGYRHTSGTFQAKLYQAPIDLEEAYESPFCSVVVRPFMAESRSEALKIIKARALNREV